MAIKLGGDTNITLTNTSFVGDVYPSKKSVPLFTATSNGTYYFEGDLQDSGVMSTSLNVNSTPKQIWTYYDTVSHHVSYEFTLVTGDVVEIEVSGYGTGSNLSVVRYADEIKEIYVGEGTLVDDYSAMQGPAPTGYHIPSKDEWVALCGILTTTFSMAKNSTTMGTYLKMPPAGYRSYSSASTGQLGGHGRYWSSTPSSTINNAYYLFFSSSAANPQNYDRYAYGYSVRCFKDTPVIPDSSWTALYEGDVYGDGTYLYTPGIFRNATLGLISISPNGKTTDASVWITIADKNLGATTVFNQGDTVTDANCGYFYQWGNNYGFAHSGTVTTSSTQVDASNYGPGNYYSSSTFIIGNSNWSSVKNDNLWGGVTGVQQEQVGNVTEVYVGTTKVRPST